MSFTYCPLVPARNEIRLLRYLPQDKRPSSTGSIIKCSLLHVSLDDNPQYHALSYVWGRPERTFQIFINGSFVYVTESLGEALQRLQSEKIQYLWVDALCINQSDNNEKSDQVQKMGIIYERAQGVLAWLGSNERLELAISDINVGGRKLLWRAAIDHHADMSMAARKPAVFEKIMKWDLLGRREEQGVALSNLYHLVATQEKRELLLEDIGWAGAISPSTLHSWANLLQCQLWTRIWIFQELTLAKNCWLVSNNVSTKLEYLLAIYQLVLSLILFSSRVEDPSWGRFSDYFMNNKMVEAVNDVRITGQAKKEKLADLLRTTCSLSATIPQDRIFALLGVASDVQALGLRVNYSKSLEEICEDIVKSSLYHHGFDVFSRANTLHPPQLPTWVTIHPGISIGETHEFPISYKRLLSKDIPDFPFSASGTSIPNLSHLNFPEPGKLRLRASFIGEMAEWGYVNCSPTIGFRDTGIESEYDAMNRCIEEMERKLSRNVTFQSIENPTAPPFWWLPILHRDPEAADSASKEAYRNSNEQLYESYMALRGILQPSQDMDLARNATLLWRMEKSQKYYRLMAMLLNCRYYFSTTTGYAGIGYATDLGDRIVLFEGADVPFVVRPTADGYYKLNGEAYILGVMHGELVGENYATEWITLI
jgi:Heterokaryon incompatibility protein (HET)